MTVDELREKGWIIFEAISGSRAYGTDLPTSDTDIRGIFIQPTQEVLKANPTVDGNYPYIPQVNDETNDVVFYEIGRFIELLEKGNPNILELLNVPEDCVVFKSFLMDDFFPDKTKFITKKLRHSFVGYAKTQISKAKGMNKKVNTPQPVKRKILLDFCYLLEGEKSIPILQRFPKEELDEAGVVSLPHGRDIYALYIDKHSEYQFRGVVNPNGESNEIRLSSIPKDYPYKALTFWYNKDGYTAHCKDYKEYWEWVNKRNPDRYKDNMKGEVGYDHKNMMHCVRLIQVAQDIIDKNEIVVRRPNRDYLLSIRNGGHTYEDLLKYVEENVAKLDEAFETSNLPDEVDTNYTRNLLLQIRLNN